MTEIDPEAWYPKQMYIDLWNLILEKSRSAMFDLVGAGMSIAYSAWPPEADQVPVEDLFRDWGAAYDAVNRGADRGYIKTTELAPNHWSLHIRTPDPDDLNYGVIYGFCKRFLPEGTPFSVRYDESVTRRDNGGDETVITVQW